MILLFRLDDDSEEEEEETVEETPSLEPEVKRRERKSYSRDSVDDSIFSFDGWSKMKNVSFLRGYAKYLVAWQFQ